MPAKVIIFSSLQKLLPYFDLPVCFDIFEKIMEYLSFKDLLVFPVYFLLVVFFALIWRNRKLPVSDPVRKYFIPGLILKLIGGTGVALIYTLYYGGGDTVHYFRAGNMLFEIAKEDPILYLRVLLNTGASIEEFLPGFRSQAYFFYNDSTLLISKIASVLNVFSFDSFLGTSLLYTTLSFWGVWKLLRFFLQLFPKYPREMAFAVLFIPSVFFWGSGLLKDPLTFAAVGWLSHAVYGLFIRRKNVFSSLVYLAISTYLLFYVKVYILLAIAPALIIWMVLTYKNKIRIPFFRTMVMPVFLGIGLLFGSFLISKITENVKGFAIEQLLQTALVKQEFNAEHAQATNQNASDYDLGEIDPTPMGLIRSMPRIINITLFRPYVWETRKAVQFLSAVESFFLLCFALYVLVRMGPFRFFGHIWKDSNLIMFVCFTLIFAFAVGFTSGNFGNLVRYKIPCIPFFVATLLVLNKRMEERKALRLARR